MASLEDLGVLGQALAGLGALPKAAGECHHLVVVGGVAINLNRIRTRVTADVDIIARVDTTPTGAGIWLRPEPLPDSLERAIHQVAIDFGLPSDWMNAVIGMQWDHGLPPGIEHEVVWYDYGGLQLGVVGRQTLIALKLFAAVDNWPRSVHLQDLLHLSPSEAELANASASVATQDASVGFADVLARTIAYVAEHRR